MKISELPQPYRWLAEVNRRNGWSILYENDNLEELGEEWVQEKYESIDSFVWSATLQGYDFWYDAHSLHKGNFRQLEGYYPRIEIEWLSIKHKV